MRFDGPVPPNGYAWWYLDALSDCGKHGLTIIAFIGSVFSPYYAFARRRGPADPMNHCAMNVALYGAKRRFALTERGRGTVEARERHLAMGPSAIEFDGATVTVTINEIAAPIPQRVRGRVRLRPSGFTPGPFALDAAGRHAWWPIAPASRVEVELSEPALRWRGAAYFDTNVGSRPLEEDFCDWSWCRAPLRTGAGIFYDVVRRDGSTAGLSLDIAPSGEVRHREPPPVAALPPGTIWRMPRPTRCEAGHRPRIVRTFEDTPFYTRSEIVTQAFGGQVRAVHESLSLTRFTHPLVQMMLPFRMPRAFGRRRPEPSQ